jgi:hypothetical protein
MCVPLTFMDNWNRNEFEVVDYSQRTAFDEEKNNWLKELHEQDIKKIEKQLLLNPNDLKYQYYKKRGYSDTGFMWRPARVYYKNEKKGLIRWMTGFIVKNKADKILYIAPKSPPKLKNDNPLLDNKIYFYTSPFVPACICIGQTKGDIEKRIKQEFKNTPEKPYKILHSDLAQKSNGEWFKDKDFHKFLNANGYANETGKHSKNNEWFKIDIKTALKLFKEYKKMKL